MGLYISTIFDWFALVLRCLMSTNMKADLCVRTLENALTAYPSLKDSVIYSDQGTQYTSGIDKQAFSMLSVR